MPFAHAGARIKKSVCGIFTASRMKPQKTRTFSRAEKGPGLSVLAAVFRAAYFFRYSRGVMPKCALNARLK